MDILPRTWKKEKKTGVPVFVIFSFIINTDTALSWSLYDGLIVIIVQFLMTLFSILFLFYLCLDT